MNKPAPAPVPALIEQHTVSDKKTKTIPLAGLVTKGMQLRVTTDKEAVARYAEAYANGEELPPIVVFDDGTELLVADGHHRVAASLKAGKKSIECIIKKGDRRAARLYASRANLQHGVPLTNDDKRNIVRDLLGDAEWFKWSDREIARHTGTSPNFVGKIRKTLPKDQQSTVRKGKDGIERDTKNIGKAVKPKAPETKPGEIQIHPTEQEIEATQCTGIIAGSKKAPTLKKAVTIRAHLYVLASDLVELMTPLDYALAYPDAPTGNYHEMVNSATGYQGIQVTYKGQPYVLGGRDRELNPKTWGKATPGLRILTDDQNDLLMLDQFAYDMEDPEAIPGCSTSGAASFAQVAPWKAEACTKRLLAKQFIKQVLSAEENGEREPLYVITPLGAAHLQSVELPVDDDDGPEELGPSDVATIAAHRGDEPSTGGNSASEDLTKETPPIAADTPAGKRLTFARELLGERLAKEKHQWCGRDQELVSLALVVGVPMNADDEPWSNDLVVSAWSTLADRIQAEVADRLTRGETTRLPPIELLAKWWGIDHAALVIQAERAVGG